MMEGLRLPGTAPLVRPTWRTPQWVGSRPSGYLPSARYTIVIVRNRVLACLPSLLTKLCTVPKWEGNFASRKYNVDMRMPIPSIPG